MITERLVLRKPKRSDGDELYRVVKSRRVSQYMFLPFPYERRHASDFIRRVHAGFRRGTECHFVFEKRDDGSIIGAGGLIGLSETHRHAELGYWIGVRYWGKRYGTEAAGRLVEYGFKDLGLHRIFARTMPANVASSRLLMGLGFELEGYLRHHVKHRGRWQDIEVWGLLRHEFE